MARAIWGGKVLAESNECVLIEGNHYFPPGAVNKKHFVPSGTTSVCPWKGTAHYYHVEVDGMRNADAAWYYPEPKEAAVQIRGYVAFWRGVIIER